MFDDEGFEDYEGLIKLPIEPGPDSSDRVGSSSDMFDSESPKISMKTPARRHVAKISSDYVYTSSSSSRRKTNYSTSSSSIGSNAESAHASQKGFKQNVQTRRPVSRLLSAVPYSNNSNSINKALSSNTSQSRNKRKPVRLNSHQTYSNLPKQPKLSRYHSNQEVASYVDDDLDFDDCDIEVDDDIDLTFDIEPYPVSSTDHHKYRWSGSSKSIQSRNGAPIHSSGSGSRKSDIQVSPGNEDRRLMHNAQERKRRGVIKKLKKELEGILPERLKRSVLGEAFKPDQSLSNPDISRCLEAYTKEISEAFSEAEMLKDKWKRLKNALDSIEGSSGTSSSFSPNF